MKDAIHPTYMECKVICGCGNGFTTISTQSELRVEICSACHPFYTGKQKYVDTAGRVQKFENRFNWDPNAVKKKAEEKSAQAKKKPKLEKKLPAATKSKRTKKEADGETAGAEAVADTTAATATTATATPADQPTES